MASDSQTTTANSKRTDIDKISVVELANAKALVAESGAAALSGRAVEILQDMARNQPLDDYRTVADLAQKAMRQLKDELRLQNCDCTMEELRDFLVKNDLGCALMLAHYFNGKPYIYTLDIHIGIANKAKSFYETLGCGANLGSYLLGEYASADMEPDFAAIVSTYTIETVKRHDAFCGGQTKLGCVRVDGVEIMPPRQIELLVHYIAEIDEQTKEDRNQRTREAMHRVIKDRIFPNLFDMFKAQP